MTSGSWVVQPLGQIARLERGKFSARPRNDPRYFGGQIPFVQTGDVRSSDGWIVRFSSTLNDRGAAVSKIFPKGTLLMTIAANIGDVGVTSFECAAPDSLIAVHPLRGVDKRWLYYALLARKSDLESVATNNTQLNINLEKLNPFQILVPPEAEQRAIAEDLSDADRLITGLERLLAKKRAIKKGMMQKLLTGRTRLPVFSGEWTVRRIGTFADVRAGGTPSTSVSRYWGGQVRWMSSGEIHQKRVREVLGRITPDGLRESAAQLLPVGTVLMALAGQGKTRGTVAVSEVELSTNQSIAGILPGTEHDSEFLYHNLGTRYEELRGESAGDGGRGGLNLTIIKRLSVNMPSLTEQRAIAAVLRDTDANIDAIERRLEATRAIKQGMMQELLTGRTRLTPTEMSE